MRSPLLALVLSAPLAFACGPRTPPDRPVDGGSDSGDAAADGDQDPGPAFGRVRPLFVRPPGDRAVAAELVALVDRAERTVDLAAFIIDHEGFVEALERAVGRGVVLRVVSDSETAAERSAWAIERLEALGAEVSLQRDPRFSSHNKFLVVDGRWVWTGSTNFSGSCLGWNNNASLLVDSPEVAADFTREIEQMLAGRFGERKVVTDDQTSFTVDGVRLQTRFAPQERPDESVIALIDDARDHVFFMIYLFTLDEIAAALLRAARRGVVVRGIIDQEFADQSGAALLAELRAGGVEVGRDINMRGVWHHKVLIVDPQGESPTVALGSGNWTWSLGHGNDENYVIVRDRMVVRAFLEEFQRWLP